MGDQQVSGQSQDSFSRVQGLDTSIVGKRVGSHKPKGAV